MKNMFQKKNPHLSDKIFLKFAKINNKRFTGLKVRGVSSDHHLIPKSLFMQPIDIFSVIAGGIVILPVVQQSPMAPDEKTGKHRQHTVFDPSRAGHLDSRLRRFIYRPDRLARCYVRPGDKVLDFGCGPGFFTREFANVVGESGRVFAVDLQEEMLEIVRGKMETGFLLPRVTLHRCEPDSINLPADLNGTLDAAFAIFVVHEVPDPYKLFGEIFSLLKSRGSLFFSEPPFEVSGREFDENLEHARDAGFQTTERSWFFVNRAAVLRKG